MNTTTQLITNAIFNLATHPEYVPMLKEEIDSVLGESGGVWTLESMEKLKKTDSFLKETLRYNGHLTGEFFQARWWYPSGVLNLPSRNSHLPAKSATADHSF